VRIYEAMLDTVCFLYAADGNGKHRYGGTGFIVKLHGEENPCRYLVTAKHCKEEASTIGRLCARFNLSAGGTTSLDLSGRDWYEPEDQGVDLALTVLPSMEGIKVRPICVCGFVSDADSDYESPGIGDDVFIVGMFPPTRGTSQNLPVVRGGILSALPGEDFIDDRTGHPFKAYLTESRSLGGLSGSPVAVVTSWMSNWRNQYVESPRSIGHQGCKLLGIVRGHFFYEAGPGYLIPGASNEEIHAGLSYVTPIQELTNLLHRADVSKAR